jgi:hypothetical protein
VHDVEAVAEAWSLRDDPPIGVAHRHHAVLDLRWAPDLVELPNADNVRLEPRDPLHVRQCLVPPAIDGEHDDAT